MCLACLWSEEHDVSITIDSNTTAGSRFLWAVRFDGCHCHLLLQTGQAFLDRCTNELTGLTDLVKGQLSSAERLMLGALITVDVHACDVVRELVEAGEGEQQSRAQPQRAR